jgi:hypothetical protein
LYLDGAAVGFFGLIFTRRHAAGAQKQKEK